MYHKRTKRLVELCPQCYKSVDSSVSRLVQDACGHSKCRICLLTEVSGCLICEVQQREYPKDASSPTQVTLDLSRPTQGTPQTVETTNEEQPCRKSVITSVASQLAELSKERENNASPLCSPMDKETCMILKQRYEDDILFPTTIAKRSTGNFYHLKRVFSERFFSDEDKNKNNEDSNKQPVDVDSSHQDNQLEQANSCGDSSEHDTPLSNSNNDNNTAANNSYQCKVCSKVFQSNSKLNKHLFIHTRKSRFKCEQCNKIFKDNYALNCHKRTHTLEKPYSCKYCNKQFSEINNLKRHDKQHRNEKNFKCKTCNAKFFTKYDMKRHSAKHSNDKEHTCTICQKQFKFKKCLTRHLFIHNTNPDSFICNLCEAVFKRKDNLKRHMRSCHVDVNNDEETNCDEPKLQDNNDCDNLLHWKRRSVQNFSNCNTEQKNSVS